MSDDAAAQRAPVIQTRGLTKVYGQRTVVDRLELRVPRGLVFGLLGENGAGKSTTIRMLLGLVRATAGQVELFGRPFHEDPLGLLRRVGALIEGPAYYPYLSGAKNLQLFGDLSGGVSAERVQACLERVGLGDRGHDLYRGYSTGMRQRLGIAGAILHDPELVILDEPLNGLDPPAIVLVRDLIRALCRDEGKSVLISSHLLHEVELSCDEVAIMRKGVLLEQGAVGDLLQPGDRCVEVRCPNLAAARAIAEPLDWVTKVSEHEGNLVCELADERAADLNRALVEAGVAVEALIPRRRTLEELFADLNAADREVRA